MSHEFDSGMFVNADGHKEWHKLGVVVSEPPKTTAEAMQIAGMNWQVVERKFRELSDPVTDLLLPPDRVLGETTPGWKQLHRSDNGHLLHVCRDTWQPLQNEQAFRWFDPIIQDGDAHISAAVSLREGRRVAITVKLREQDPLEVVPGDRLEPYLLLFNSHDGTLAVGVKPTFIRVVCHNTLSANLVGIKKNQFAEKGKDIEVGNKFVKIRHTANMINNLELARDLFNIVTRRFATDVEAYKIMAAKQLTAGEFEKYVAKVFKVEADVAEVDAGIQGTRRWEPIARNFESGTGSEMAGKTVWGALNAITDWTSHERGGLSEDVDVARRRLDALWFAEGDRINARAHEFALELIKA